MNNIATRIEHYANVTPNKKAVVAPKGKKYESLSFKELNQRSKNYASKLTELGLKEKDKALVFIRPGLDFPVVTFALFRIGVIPIFIDPGMGKEMLLKSIEDVKPDALIAVPEVHLARLFYPKAFKSVKHFITTKGLSLFGVHSLHSWNNLSSDFKNPVPINEDDMAAILFTSGGTGIPKGVVYTHKIFNTQTDTLKDLFKLTDQDIDIPGFPLFALFTMAMGMTSCIPDMNPSKPAKCDPKKLVKNIQDNKGTFVAGSPAIWERVANYCTDHKIKLPTIKYLVMFGAPVSPEIHRKFQKILPNGTTYTPYGATESLPVSNVEGHFLLEETIEKTEKGLGTCVGKIAPNIDLKIIKITDEVIKDIQDIEELPTNTLGEIIVKGDVVTKEYYQMPHKTAEAKIYDGKSVWHRMGDIGRIDENGLLWFCGRKGYRVEVNGEVRSSIQCEAIFNQHPQVKRTALIPNKNKAALVVEMKNSNLPIGIEKVSLIKELKLLGSKYSHTDDIKDFYFSKSFPVDIRHNIKIDRKKLKEMAEQGKLQ